MNNSMPWSTVSKWLGKLSDCVLHKMASIIFYYHQRVAKELNISGVVALTPTRTSSKAGFPLDGIFLEERHF